MALSSKNPEFEDRCKSPKRQWFLLSSSKNLGSLGHHFGASKNNKLYRDDM